MWKRLINKNNKYTRQLLKEGGYEAEAFVLHGYRGPFVPENEWIILGAVIEAEERLHTPKEERT
ncbi:hypothetical protein [Paenibacillus sp. V4I5]|uniref:hypothetical protein n=1 Tax=Paenibacillus sp. V4I5 TaxID=3042306 RepID=UPI0027D908BE|nr:hypothetical protein [Paenibacillus sp. V4I5]